MKEVDPIQNIKIRPVFFRQIPSSHFVKFPLQVVCSRQQHSSRKEVKCGRCLRNRYHQALVDSRLIKSISAGPAASTANTPLEEASLKNYGADVCVEERQVPSACRHYSERARACAFWKNVPYATDKSRES